MPHPLVEIRALCRDRKIFLIEDCALSLFSSDGQVRLGTQGDISVFSFRKTLPVPDGGAVVVNDPDLSAGDWKKRNPPILSVSRGLLSLAKRYVLNASSQSGVLYSTLWSLLKRTHPGYGDEGEFDTFFPEMAPYVYYDARLDNRDISGISRRMLRTFDSVEIRSRRRKNYGRYLDLLSSCEGVEPLYRELPEGVCPLHFPVFVSRRDAMCRELNALAIDAVPWWSGYHRSLPWPEYPDACLLKDRLLALPVHQGLGEDHIAFICEKLRRIVRKLPACSI
jgi:perosamine synthetase